MVAEIIRIFVVLIVDILCFVALVSYNIHTRKLDKEIEEHDRDDPGGLKIL